MSLELNCANCIETGHGIEIPPKNAKRYPTKVGRRDIIEYRKKGGSMIEIPVEGSVRTVEDIEK